MIGCICYDHIDLIAFVRNKTSPVRPTGMMAGNITVQVDQLYGRQTALRWSVEPTEVMIFGTKTHGRGISFLPAA